MKVDIVRGKMSVYRLALIGFGNVAQGLTQIIYERGAQLAEVYGVCFEIVAVSDVLKGGLYDPAGLSPALLLETIRSEGTLNRIAAPYKNWDARQTIIQSNADIVVEMSYTDLKTGEPALSYIDTALEQGKHVVTTNKGPIALHYPQIAAQAQVQGVTIGFEGTVMSGTPTLRLGQTSLAAAGITQIQGILNGTTNYILTQMGNGASYEEALAQAQAQGYAEADPTGDVEGHDAAGKVVILANMLMMHLYA